jgi:hypothetical protein
MKVLAIFLKALAILIIAAVVSLIVYVHDEHRVVICRMGWECIGVEDTIYPQYPHIESAKFWYRDNPRFEERASGPKLCLDLKASGASDVEMTFDAWGNRFQGLHGYDTTKLTANGKEIVLYGGESGGYHGDPGYGNFDGVEDKRLHPEKYKFPVDPFTP